MTRRASHLRAQRHQLWSKKLKPQPRQRHSWIFNYDAKNEFSYYCEIFIRSVLQYVIVIIIEMRFRLLVLLSHAPLFLSRWMNYKARNAAGRLAVYLTEKRGRTHGNVFSICRTRRQSFLLAPDYFLLRAALCYFLRRRDAASISVALSLPSIPVLSHGFPTPFSFLFFTGFMVLSVFQRWRVEFSALELGRILYSIRIRPNNRSLCNTIFLFLIDCLQVDIRSASLSSCAHVSSWKMKIISGRIARI